MSRNTNSYSATPALASQAVWEDSPRRTGGAWLAQDHAPLASTGMFSGTAPRTLMSVLNQKYGSRPKAAYSKTRRPHAREHSQLTNVETQTLGLGAGTLARRKDRTLHARAAIQH